MNKKLLLVIGILAVFTGCGQQPELDVTDQNTTEQNNTQVEQNLTPTQSQDNVQPDEADLSDTTSIQVTTDSLNSDNSNSQDNVNQNLVSLLSSKVVHFDFDKYNIRQDQLEIVQEIANILKDYNGNYTIRIEGNCDEWGSDEYNYALGLKRAKTLKQALIDLGVDGNKLTIISYGESNPVCVAHNSTCWAKNRRDNLTVLP